MSTAWKELCTSAQVMHVHACSYMCACTLHDWKKSEEMLCVLTAWDAAGMPHTQEHCVGDGGYGGDDVHVVRGLQGDAKAHRHGHSGACTCTQGWCSMCAGACEERARYVIRGQRVTEQQARAHAGKHGSVVCVVHELAGGGCCWSVSACTYQWRPMYACVYACQAAGIQDVHKCSGATLCLDVCACMHASVHVCVYVCENLIACVLETLSSHRHVAVFWKRLL